MSMSNVLNVFGLLRSTPNEISRETKKKFKLGITGSPDMVASFYEVLTAGMLLDGLAGSADAERRQYIDVIPMPIDDITARSLRTDLIIYLLNEEDATRENLLNFRELYKRKPPVHLFIEEPEDLQKKEHIQNVMDELFLSGREFIKTDFSESIAEKADVILKMNKKVDYALAHRFPILRPAFVKNLIHDSSLQNMIIALASSLPNNIPVIGIIIGLLSAAGETTVLTINQLKMCLQIAGVYGLRLSVFDRIKELWPLVGSALVFRTVARNLVGFVPVAGPAIKGAIGYGGTSLVGETVHWYYEKGRKLTPDELKQLKKESREKAFSSVRGFLDSLKLHKGKSDGEKATFSEDDVKAIDGIREELDELEKSIDDEVKTIEIQAFNDKPEDIVKRAAERLKIMDKSLGEDEPTEENSSAVTHPVIPEEASGDNKVEKGPEKAIVQKTTVLTDKITEEKPGGSDNDKPEESKPKSSKKAKKEVNDKPDNPQKSK